MDQDIDIFKVDPYSPEARELKAAAFEVLMFFPGIDFTRWCQALLKEYTEEVVDALGDDAQSVMESLYRLWHESEYEDDSTNIKKRYAEWSALFRNQEAVDYYRSLVEEANRERGI